VGEGLLSLIPHLIKHAVASWWLGVGVAGWNISLLVRTVLVFVAGAGLTHCWVLRGHPVVVGVFLVPSLAWPA
jgi:hypothetical protein